MEKEDEFDDGDGAGGSGGGGVGCETVKGAEGNERYSDAPVDILGGGRRALSREKALLGLSVCVDQEQSANEANNKKTTPAIATA